MYYVRYQETPTHTPEADTFLHLTREATYIVGPFDTESNARLFLRANNVDGTVLTKEQAIQSYGTHPIQTMEDNNEL